MQFIVLFLFNYYYFHLIRVLSSLRSTVVIIKFRILDYDFKEFFPEIRIREFKLRNILLWIQAWWFLLKTSKRSWMRWLLDAFYILCSWITNNSSISGWYIIDKRSILRLPFHQLSKACYLLEYNSVYQKTVRWLNAESHSFCWS